MSKHIHLWPVKPAEISGHLDLLFQYCGVSFSVRNVLKCLIEIPTYLIGFNLY